MPLIPFPNVPELPGVPDLRRATVGLAVRTGIYGKIEAFDRFGILDLLIGPPYQIVSAVTGEPVIRPDSVISLEYKGESRMAGYPMEKGAFSTYNKVQMPYDLRMRMTCSGNSWMKREDFIFKMDEIKKSLEMLQIITPDVRYTGVNLVHWDYKRTAQNGVSLLTVDAMFSEVRENATAVYGPVKEPASADPKSMSCIAPIDPTASEELSYMGGHAA